MPELTQLLREEWAPSVGSQLHGVLRLGDPEPSPTCTSGKSTQDEVFSIPNPVFYVDFPQRKSLHNSNPGEVLRATGQQLTEETFREAVRSLVLISSSWGKSTKHKQALKIK